jgi:diguanylate cyclase (GGDEF)-like protein
VIVDGTPVPFDGGVRVEPGQRDVEITYGAPGFEAESIRFRYTLDGLNDGWIDAGTRRTLHYSYLAPGDYTFRVQAAASDGRWSGVAAALRLSVRPAVHQTLWFRGAVFAGLVVSGAWLVSTLRVRRLQQAELILTARMGEATAELAAANRRLEELATIDELTQLTNRRRFSEVLEQEWQRATRERIPLGMLMLDVDCFKRYNDTYGHQAGDSCLQRVAAVLASRARRPSDLAARYGGEEFAVVLPGADEAGVMAVGEWIRAEVERQRIPHGASLAGDVVTVSVGAAVARPAPGAEPAALVAAADAALYRAKEGGRNAVIAGMMDTSLDAGAAATRLSRVRIHHQGS